MDISLAVFVYPNVYVMKN